MTRRRGLSGGQAYHLYRPARVFPRRVAIVLAAVLLAVIALGVAQMVRRVSPPRLTVTLATRVAAPGQPVALPWPALGQGSIALEGAGTISSFGAATQQLPIASVTKIMTALVVLRDHPLAPGQAGPTIIVGQADVSSYQAGLGAGDSVVKVVLGERLSEQQALEGLLVPSGDNFADLLAVWDAGSRGAFVSKMNALASSLGLSRTHYAGVSGVNPATVSTASDQMRLATLCMRLPAFAAIAAMPQVTLPVAGVQYNVDADLGADGIIGVKTGWVPRGGADFVFAAIHAVQGRNATVLGTILGEQGRTPLPSVLSAAERVVTAVDPILGTEPVVGAGTVVGRLRTPYARSVSVVTAKALHLLAWPGAELKMSVHTTRRLAGALPAGARVGTLTAMIGSERATVSLVTTRGLPRASIGWRLTRL